MEITPAKLLVACVAIFGGIVAIGVITQSQGNEQLKSNLLSLDLSAFRSRLQREEGISPQPVSDEDADSVEEPEAVEGE